MSRRGTQALCLLALLLTTAAALRCSVQPLLTVGRQCQHKAECAPGLICDPTTKRCALARDGGPLPDGPRGDTTRDSAPLESGTPLDGLADRGDTLMPDLPGPSGDSSVDSSRDSTPSKLSCSIDVKGGTHNCSAPVTQTTLSPGRGRFVVDLQGCAQMVLTARFCNASGWTLHVGNSASNDGYGGDAISGGKSNDSELQVLGTSLSVYGNDDNPAGAGALMQTIANFVPATGCVERTLTISDGQVVGDQGLSVTSAYVFRLGAPDSGGSDHLVYLGLDGVVSGSSARTGSGLDRLDITLR